ncbi:MAG: DNA repair protein RecO [Paracoccaceae bacterium]|nr:DNA repair protein RecO [Paracoccaceae bacterium]
MEWRDQGFLLGMRRHGESSAIIEVFSEQHGRHAGVVRGGASRRLAPLLQQGNQMQLTWRARLEEHLGTFTVEPLQARAAALMSDRRALAGLNSVTALLRLALPEREAHVRLYQASVALLDEMVARSKGWPGHYLHWELLLLEEMGFGLDLTSCAVTGQTSDLVHVSPRSGRAVSRQGAGGWADRLLPFPDPQMPADGLRTTGHFLEQALGDAPLPEARARLLEVL